MKKISLKSKITFTNILLMTITILLTLIITLKLSINKTSENLKSNIMNVSKLVSANEKVIDCLSKKKQSKELINYLDEIINMTENVDVIVVADNNGKRYYHPDKSKIGEVFKGGDEISILKDCESYISTAEGTLGKQLRSFTAIKDNNGKQVGFVMVSCLMNNIKKDYINIIKTYFVVGIFVFNIGILMSIYLSKNIKKSLLGYEPEQFTKLYLQKKEVLGALEEGIVAIDNEGKIVTVNNSAMDMLDIEKDKQINGEFVENVFKDKNFINIIKSQKAEYNKEITTSKDVIMIDSIPIIENKEIMGTVSICRNKTEVIRLAEELTGVNQVIEALRANTHEFMNKLHVVLGLIQINKIEEAKTYIINTNDEQKELMNLIVEKIKDPNIAALLIGKIKKAKELGINLNLQSNSYLEKNNKFLNTNSLITILGNLIENSIDSIEQKDDDYKEINILIYNDDKSLLISIDDSGEGISEKNINEIYKKGFSTKGENRGIGMYLIKNIVDNCGGSITIESEENVGTWFNIIISDKEYKND